MHKKGLIISLAALSLLVAGLGVSKVLAAGGNYSSYGMMRNFDNDDAQKMAEAHNLMAQGKYEEARQIMKDLGMGNCPMMGNQERNGNDFGNNDDFGGMMGGNGMMGNYR